MRGITWALVLPVLFHTSVALAATQAGIAQHAREPRHSVAEGAIELEAVTAKAIPADLIRIRTARPPADVPLDHWSYPFLERLVARGALDLDLTTRPISRTDVAEALLRLKRTARGRSGKRWEPKLRDDLTERERWMLVKLRAEFLLNGAVDTPFVAAYENDASVSLGLELSTNAGYAGPQGEVEPSVSLRPQLRGGVGDDIGFYADIGVVAREQAGPRKVRLSSRLRTWRGVSADVERAYFKMEHPSFSLGFGRRGAAWGPSRWGRLLLSGSGPTLDQADARLSVGRFSFHALHALLECGSLGTQTDLAPGERVFLGAHRLVYRWGSGSIGLSECIVYSACFPEPIYASPLVPYYVSQFNEGDDANVLCALDLVYRPVRGVEVRGEFLADDLMYEREAEHPEKYGFTLGACYWGAVAGSDVELIAEYSQVRKWTYSYAHVEHRLEHVGRPVGFDLGADSDRLALGVAYYPGVAWSLRVDYFHERKGEGQLAVPFEAGEDPDPPFPSGCVKITDRASIGLEFNALNTWFGRVGSAHDWTKNRGNVADENGHEWEIWAGIGLRL